jgi:hypothetical protein
LLFMAGRNPNAEGGQDEDAEGEQAPNAKAPPVAVNVSKSFLSVSNRGKKKGKPAPSNAATHIYGDGRGEGKKGRKPSAHKAKSAQAKPPAAAPPRKHWGLRLKIR